MILTTSESLERNFYINEILDMCKKFINRHDIKNLPCGKYLIDGENMYVNVVSYCTKDEAECIWEAHRDYLDIHYIIEGKEQIRVSNIKNMKVQEYIQESDYVKMNGDASSYINLGEGEYLILFFEDAHMTGCYIEEPEVIRKAIFKVHRKMIEE